MRVHLLILLVAVGACGSDGSSSAVDGAPPPDAEAVGRDARDASRPDGSAEPLSNVYAHSGTVLYRLDMTSLEPVEIGPFDIGGQTMTDIAVDKDDVMVGITLGTLYTIDADTGAASILVELDEGAPDLDSLSFVPEDLDRPDGLELLVAAADDGTVYQIDRSTGAVTQIGVYGTSGAETIRSAGDIMAVRGLGIFASVAIGDTPGDPDYLASVDPTTWNATPLGGGTGYDRISGVGFLSDTVYGFVDGGAGNGGTIVELDVTTGAAQLLSQSDIRWSGAGVSTDAATN